MTELDQWIQKAEGDYRTSLRQMEFGDADGYDAVCFHAQQCVEKYLKAFLVAHNVEFKPRHDLIYLLSLVLTVESTFEFIRSELDFLNDHAVDIRYPGDFAVKEEAEDAIRRMKVVRQEVREKLEL
ncbi:MAG: HEPN domain-containing protein [Bacteroidota bacterium]